MYRRLEVIHPELRWFYQGEWHKEPASKHGILAAADTSWLDTLRGPDRDIPSNTRFFFTEKGWREVGRQVVPNASGRVGPPSLAGQLGFSSKWPSVIF